MPEAMDRDGNQYRIPGPFPSVDHMKRANANAGGNWFSKDTMRFFSSRVAPGVHAGRFFITSERSGFDHSSPRAYTIRAMDDEGGVSTIGEFLQYPTLRAARAAVKRLVADAS